MLISFKYNSEEIACFNVKSDHVPQIGSFVHIINEEVDEVWKVQQVKSTFMWQKGIGDREPDVTVFLRKLRPGELGNFDDPGSW